MTMRLTDAQRALLLSEPLEPGHTTKIRRAAKLANTTLAAVAGALKIPYQQLNRYVAGADPLLSTAWRVANLFGVTPCDLWPLPPKAQRGRAKAKTSAKGRKGISQSRKAPKAVAA